MKLDDEKTIESIEGLARIMDSQFQIPGSKIKIGLDTLVGLIPVVGDTIGMGVSGYIIARSANLGVPKPKIARMMFNSGIDWLIGIVPIAGDVFDLGWKANNKNAAILRAHYEKSVNTSADMIDVTPQNQSGA